jgi:ferredoxin
MKVSLDGESCVGSGQCVAMLPAVFAQNDDGISYVIDEHPPADLEERVREAWDSCPVMAIRIDED